MQPANPLPYNGYHMPNTIETRQANEVRIGMDAEQVRDLLGEPAQVLQPNDTALPSDAFAELGSMFRFGDQGLEEVWAYRHSVRIRLKFLFGFRDGKLAQAWHHTSSQG